MAENVQWIKLIVGMFDGESFKRIKRAKIGGESFRDKLEAVWFELMDLAGKCNHDGAFINSREIPYTSLDDIATMIDRETDELKLCMQFYINEGMVEIINDVFMLSNWQKYQNTDGLEKIRERKIFIDDNLISSCIDDDKYLENIKYLIDKYQIYYKFYSTNG